MTTLQPQWQPISMLPVFTDMVDGMLDGASVQLRNLRMAADLPHVLDDTALDRIIEQYAMLLDNHWLHEEQFARWKRDPLSDAEDKEVNRLIGQLPKLKAAAEEILALAHSMENETIDKVLDMDELELALQRLTSNTEIEKPCSPGHCMMILNDHMRTDILESVHQRGLQHRHDMAGQSPLNMLIRSLEEVLETVDSAHPVERLERNPFNLAPRYRFDPEHDRRHDIELLTCQLSALQDTKKVA